MTAPGPYLLTYDMSCSRCSTSYVKSSPYMAFESIQCTMWKLSGPSCRRRRMAMGTINATSGVFACPWVLKSSSSSNGRRRLESLRWSRYSYSWPTARRTRSKYGEKSRSVSQHSMTSARSRSSSIRLQSFASAETAFFDRPSVSSRMILASRYGEKFALKTQRGQVGHQALRHRRFLRDPHLEAMAGMASPSANLWAYSRDRERWEPAVWRTCLAKMLLRSDKRLSSRTPSCSAWAFPIRNCSFTLRSQSCCMAALCVSL
mmetsp:Transcript_6324/g.24607  ORF Transcript_6324/g.24607 Transcript_6324/m.24607 type:complete len:261 (+) Transcript_6324:342-1124(+)